MCNDMFDCIAKHSFEKDDIYDYDYIIKTSQEKIKEVFQDKDMKMKLYEEFEQKKKNL